MQKLGSLMLSSILIMGSMIGCSVQTGTKVAQDIVNFTPTLVSAVATADATASLLLPADAPIFTAATAGFDAAATIVVADAKAYLANPSASVLADLQTAITSLEQNVNAAILQAAGIKDSASQKLASAAIQGVATTVNLILGLIQSVSTKAAVAQMAANAPVKMAAVRPYLDENKMRPVAAKYGITVDQFYAAEARAGF